MANAQQSNPTPKQALQALILDPDLERLEDLLAEFNLFDVLGIARKELQHSAFLAWLLNPSGSHSLRDYFLRAFLSEAARGAQDHDISAPTPFDVDAWKLGDIEVATEVAVDRGRRDRIDVLLIGRSDGFVCIIENKIGSGEAPNQLSKYLEAVEEEYAGLDALPILLTPDGTEPRTEEDAERYVPLGYQEIAELVDKVLETRRSTISASVASFLEQYARTLWRHVLSTAGSIDELAYRIYDKHRAAIDLINKAQSDRATLRRETGLGMMEAAIARCAPDLEQDVHNKNIRRFFSSSLEEIPELAKGSGWTETGRMVLFEFKESNQMRIGLTVGPGPQETRQRLRHLAQRSGFPFKVSSNFGKTWAQIYPKVVLGRQDYNPFDPEKALPKVEQAIRDFYENDYWPIVDSIRGEFGLGPVTAD